MSVTCALVERTQLQCQLEASFFYLMEEEKQLIWSNTYFGRELHAIVKFSLRHNLSRLCVPECHFTMQEKQKQD